MKRRTFLKATAVTPIAASGEVTALKEKSTVNDVADSYFDALPETKTERNDTVIQCANELCSARKAISGETLNAVVDSGESVSDVVRRLQFGVRLLNEYNITDKIDESMIESGRRDLSKYTRYLPLIGSFNNLCNAACVVETPDPNPEVPLRVSGVRSGSCPMDHRYSVQDGMERNTLHRQPHIPPVRPARMPRVYRSTDERTPLGDSRLSLR